MNLVFPNGSVSEFQLDWWDRVSDILRSPCCGAFLSLEKQHLECRQCRRCFPLTDGVPLLLRDSPNRDTGDGDGLDRGPDGESK